jgi:hypothetical protein
MQPHVPLPARRPPRWLFFAGSAAILFHLTAVAVSALAAPSGPWPSQEGPNPATPPQFAFTLNKDVFGPYLRAIHLASNYHFRTNSSTQPGVTLKVRIKGGTDGKQVIAEVEVPDRGTNPWVRNRESILVSWLASDQPVMPPNSEVIPGPGQKVPTVSIWDMEEQGQLKLKTVPQHLVPRDRPVLRPSEMSLVLLRSYARHLCRQYEGASVDMVRVSRDPLPPIVLLPREPGQEEAGATLTSNYGEFSK